MRLGEPLTPRKGFNWPTALDASTSISLSLAPEKANVEQQQKNMPVIIRADDFIDIFTLYLRFSQGTQGPEEKLKDFLSFIIDNTRLMSFHFLTPSSGEL
jgi:hypothetical protein